MFFWEKKKFIACYKEHLRYFLVCNSKFFFMLKNWLQGFLYLDMNVPGTVLEFWDNRVKERPSQDLTE